MHIYPQGTISSPIEFQGPGLHTAKHHKIRILPAPANSGIVFVKKAKKRGGTPHLFGKTVQDPSAIKATWQSVVDSPLCTALLTENGEKIRTVEHLMAAFYACSIDNAMVEVEGSEIPVLDGSSKVFIEGIDAVGVTAQEYSRVIHEVTKSTEFVEGNRFIKIEPAENFALDISISLAHFGCLRFTGEMTPNIFKEEMSSARTFGRWKNGALAQLTRFNKEPVCLGANKNTALVLNSETKVLNKGGLRMSNEIIYHRVLDVVGDMMLANGHLQGKITAFSSAHRLNCGLLANLFTQKNVVTRNAKIIK